jgi:hypothetical protein
MSNRAEVVVVHRVMESEQADGLLRALSPVVEPVRSGRPLLLMDGDTGDVVARVDVAPESLARGCVQAFRTIKRGKVARASGIESASNTYGFAAPNAMMRRNIPAPSAWALTDPVGHAKLEDFARWAWRHFVEVMPDPIVQRMVEVRDSLHPAWRIADSPWTSGIANDTASLHYHRDRNNVRDTFSVMLGARSGVRGGHLHIPEYGVALPVNDRDVSWFRGVELVHGVTPMSRVRSDSFRYTYVWYPVRGFVGKGSPDEELRKAQVRRTKVEDTLIEDQRRRGLLAPGATP